MGCIVIKVGEGGEDVDMRKCKADNVLAEGSVTTAKGTEVVVAFFNREFLV
jgi:hypothetical protein